MSTPGISSTAVATQSAVKVPKAQVWTGRVLTILTVLFLLFDAIGKLVMPPQVVQASARLGFSRELTMSLGVALLCFTALYIYRRSSLFGAVLLTGYLGGAVAAQIHAGSTPFETMFPILFAVMVWAGLVLRDPVIRSVFPVLCKRSYV
jgi:DoxX-like family